MQRPPRLVHAVGKLTAGNLAYLLAQFLVFMVLTRLVPVGEVGRFSWALAITSPIFTLADMRTQQVQMTTPMAVYGYRAFLLQRVAVQGVAVVVSLALGALTSADRMTFATLSAVTALKTVEGILNVVIGEHLRDERMGWVAALQILRSVVYATSFIGVVASTTRIDLGIAAAALVLVIPLVAGHLGLPAANRRATVTRGAMLALSRESLPLGLGFFVTSLTVNAPRFVLERMHGPEELAVLAAVSYAVVLANTVVDSVTQGIMPRVAQYWREGRVAQVLRLTKQLSLAVGSFGLAGVLIAFVGGGPVLGLLFGASYTDGTPVFVVLMVMATSQYIASVLRATLIARGMRREILWVSVLNMGTALTLAFLLVPGLAATGAAMSLVGGQAVQLASYVVLFLRTLGLIGRDG